MTDDEKTLYSFQRKGNATVKSEKVTFFATEISKIHNETYLVCCVCEKKLSKREAIFYDENCYLFTRCYDCWKTTKKDTV